MTLGTDRQRVVPIWQGFDWHVALILVAALVLRIAAWWTLPYSDYISDEAEYWGAAVWLAQGRTFAFFDQWVWTRPPIYVVFLAAHIKLFGPTALWAPRLTQAILGVVLVYLVMRLGHRVAPVNAQRRVALLAGWAMALSYSFASFAYLLLSETVFLVLFVAALLALLAWQAADQLSATGRARGWLIGAGVLLGLCALTKAVVLYWLAFAALWVLWQASGVSRHAPYASRFPSLRSLINRHSLRAAGLLTLSVCAVVLPWAGYATLRWGGGDGIILIDTTGGYNFALGAQTGLPGGRDENELHDLLCGGNACDINHAARQQQAYALGWQWISQAPLNFVAKTGRELIDMIQIRFGGAERLSDGYATGAVPAPHLIGLLWDDTLYVVTLLLSVFGLLRRQCQPGKGLIVSWLLYNVVVGALIFAINRFRQPLLPFIYIYAACAVVQLGGVWSALWRRRAALALSGLLFVIILPSYVYWPKALDPHRRSILEDTWYGFVGLRDAQECAEVEAVLASGNVVHARDLHDAASARKPRGCLALLNARILDQEGKLEGQNGALQFLAQAAPPDNQAQAARVLMLEGDLYRQAGEQQAARERFAARQVEIENDLRWAWLHLNPPSTPRIDLGDGLDLGYIDGFYQREFPPNSQTPFEDGYRWSGPYPRLRFVGAGSDQPQVLRMRVNGYTNNATPTRITPSVNGTRLPPITLQPDWQIIEIPLPATPSGDDVIVAFESSVFVDGPVDLAARVRSRTSEPLRLFGMMVDWAELAPS